MEAEAVYIRRMKPSEKIDVTNNEELLTELSKDQSNKTGGTNLKFIAEKDGDSYERVSYKEGHRTGGGVYGFIGMGKTGEEMPGYPKNAYDKFNVEPPKYNLETERVMHYIYNDKAVVKNPINVGSGDINKLNPINYKNLQEEVWRSSQKGYKETLYGAHGYPFIWKAPKFEDKSKMPDKVNQELIEEAARSKYGLKFKYEHNKFGDINNNVTGSEEANLMGPKDNTVPQNKITATMKGLRGEKISGRYSGLNKY